MALKRKLKRKSSVHAYVSVSLPNDISCAARIDIGRQQRRGFPEVIYCPGKTLTQIKRIAECILRYNDVVLMTRADEKVFRVAKKVSSKAVYNRDARLVYIQKQSPVRCKGLILVISAGTSDIPVAEEAAVTAELMGNNVERLYDVGVAGIHRLLEKSEMLKKAAVLVVVAGMEGALASVVSGMVKTPVIGVPTSVGYGASFSGIAPLLTMLNSCSPGVCVVNIDNGFGAGYLAGLINKK
ncbi:MAG: nickel pincer cofactor biosynthesis protein LarB [Candidatus Omnitrophica bacterium]|nr:nickel pincer cofactor biosynthesis protein LarB [Candidatus Omnitrophota bacterium]MBU4477738.1 nickel pincer cofactor biosynthesis protein LarB [Candidatus Omnitrophota bacterium]MCG2703030.1 nickel pincer cofactor biosynthesis protein LarB [Candidatus Omnitrophota bacterium]